MDQDYEAEKAAAFAEAARKEKEARDEQYLADVARSMGRSSIPRPDWL